MKLPTIPKAAITFLCLLLTIVLVLAIVNFFFGKRICPCLRKVLRRCCCGCWKDDEDLDFAFDSDAESSGNDGSITKEAMEMEDKKSRVGSLTSDDVRIDISDRLIGITQKKQKGTIKPYLMDYAVDHDNSSIGDSIGDVDDGVSLNSTEDSKPIMAVHKRSQSSKKKSNLFRQLSISSRPGSLYGSFRSRRSSLKKSYSMDSASTDEQQSTAGVSFNGIESISIQILIAFDEDAKNLSSSIKQLEVLRKSENNYSAKNYYWQVVVEVVDQNISEPTIKNRIKTKYKTGDKIDFQRNLETENMDYDYLDNLFVRYSVFARRGTRVSHKLPFGQTNVFLTKLRQQKVLFEWRTIPPNEMNYF